MLDLAFAMGESPGTQGTQSPLGLLLPFIIIFVIFYFLLIRPQKAQQKKHQEMIQKLKKNDRVITSGGIHGTIVRVKENSIILRVDDNIKLEVQKNCIAHIVRK